MPALQKSAPIKLTHRGDHRHRDPDWSIPSIRDESLPAVLVPSWHNKIEQLGNPCLEKEGIPLLQQNEEKGLIESHPTELEKQSHCASFKLLSQAKDNKTYNKGIRQHLLEVTKKGNEVLMEMQQSHKMQDESKSDCRAVMLGQVNNIVRSVEPYKAANIFQNNVAPNQQNIVKQLAMTPNIFHQQNEKKITPTGSNRQQYLWQAAQMQEIPLRNTAQQQTWIGNFQPSFHPSPTTNSQPSFHPSPTTNSQPSFHPSPTTNSQPSFPISYTPEEQTIYQKVKDLTFGQFLQQITQNLSDLYGQIDTLSNLYTANQGFVHQTKLLLAAQDQCQALSYTNLHQSLDKIDFQLDNVLHPLDRMNDGMSPLAATHILSRYFDILTEAEREVERSSRGVTLETSSVQTPLEKLRAVAVEVQLEYQLMETQVELQLRGDRGRFI